MRRLPVLVLAGSLLGSCAGDDRDSRLEVHAAPAVGPPVAPVLPTIAPSPATPVAADPKLEGFTGWPLVFDATPGGYSGLHCTVRVARAAAVLAVLDGVLGPTTCSTTWTGRDPSGLPLAPGAVDVEARVENAIGQVLASTETRLEVVRLGIAQIDLAGAVTGAQAPLLYGATGGTRGSYTELETTDVEWRLGPDLAEGTTGAVTELADGSPRPLPAIWTDVHTPPLDARAADGLEHDSFSLPSAWVAGSAIDARVQLSAETATGVGAPSITSIRVVPPDGFSIVGADAFGDGAEIAIHSTTSPVPAVGRYDLALEWTFEARLAGGEWTPVPGGITTRHRLYGLVAQPTLRYTALPHRAWVEVVDKVAEWNAGASASPVVVGGRIVEGVYYEMGLQYDRASGASAYTWYPGGGSTGFENAQYELAQFQELGYGNIINCSDAASIVSTYANMVGIDLRYHILRRWGAGGFDLNFIQAIGWPGFTETPFTGGRGGFSYHAVVGPPDGTFYDGTLALDGDGTPTALPSTVLLAEGLPATDYIRALSSEWMYVSPRLDEKVRIR